MAEILRPGGNHRVTLRRFLERFSDEEMQSLLRVRPVRWGRAVRTRQASL
jgi:hypothetical protein